MAIASIGSSTGVSNVAAPAALVARSASSIPPAAAPEGAAPTHISDRGQFFAKLQQLAEQDPAQFKQVAQHIADEIHQAAQQSSGKKADFENALGDRFAAAAQSGDISQLRPQGPPGGGGAQHAHHHHGGGGGGGPLGAIFSSALDEVNQALASAPSATPDASAAPSGG
jgi:hypothetical protein